VRAVGPADCPSRGELDDPSAEQSAQSGVPLGEDHTGRDMEHRWGHRREISRIVRLRTRSGLASQGRFRNVSLSGAFIVSPLPVALLAYVEIQFIVMHGGRRISTALEAQVVRKAGAGFGVEWREFAPAAVHALLLVPPFRSAARVHESRGFTRRAR
jgi:hypothetical protein